MNIFLIDLGSRENAICQKQNKTKQKKLGLGYKREKSKIFFNKVYSGFAKGEGVLGGMEWDAGVSRCKLLYIERIEQ